MVLNADLKSTKRNSGSSKLPGHSRCWRRWCSRQATEILYAPAGKLEGVQMMADNMVCSSGFSRHFIIMDVMKIGRND